MGLFNFIKVYTHTHVVMLILMCNLGDDPERKGYDLVMMGLCVNLKRGQLVLCQPDRRLL